MKFILLFISTALLSLQSYAQNGYRTECLRAIAYASNLAQLTDTISEGMHQHAAYFKEHPVNIYQKCGEIYHIGYAIFPDSMRTLQNHVVFNFLERYLLQSDLNLDTLRDFNTKMNEDEVVFTKGKLKSLRRCYGDSTVTFKIMNENDKRYIVSFYSDGKEFCSLNFPISHNLLNETRMLEEEDRLLKDFSSFKLDKTVVPAAPESDSAFVTQFNSNGYVFILKGRSFILPYITSNLYYECTGKNRYELIYDKDKPVESIANMLITSAIDNDYEMEVDYRRYDYKDSIAVVKLNDFIGFFLHCGCKAYFAVKSVSGNIAKCILLMHKNDEGYAHLLSIEIDVTGIGKQKGWSKCKLYPYLPLNQVKNLFADY